MITKKELQEEIKKLATKKELQKEVKKLVTKTDFQKAMRGIDNKFDKIDIRFDNFKDYVDYRFNDLEEKMYTKKDHEVFMIWMDEAMKELRDSRDERALFETQKFRMDDKIANHEQRIGVLESKVK